MLLQLNCHGIRLLLEDADGMFLLADAVRCKMLILVDVELTLLLDQTEKTVVLVVCDVDIIRCW